MPDITTDQFTNRFTSLVLGGQILPRKQLDRHIIFISSILRLDPARQYSEGELNEELRQWSNEFGAGFGLDHVTLRRYLIDEQYIMRDAAGASYELAKDPPYSFDEAIKALDLSTLVEEARREKEERKRLYMSKGGS